MPLVWDALLHASPASRRRPDLGAGVRGKASSTRFHAPKLPPARGGEREWSCLSLHRVVVLALFPRLLPPNANVPHSPSHAKGRESGHASPCISQTTRPWSIGNRITRRAPERGAREAAANGPRGLAPPQSPLTLPRVCCSPPHRTRAFGSPELSLRDQSHPRPLTASKKLLPSLLLRHEAALPTARGEEREWTCLSLHLSSSPCFFSRDPAGWDTRSHFARGGHRCSDEGPGQPRRAKAHRVAPKALQGTPRPRPPNRNPPPTVCVHHFTPWNRCESEPLPTQSQTFHSSLTVFRVVANSFFRVAPASSNGPHPDRRPRNASDITLSYSAYAVSYAPVEASRGPHRFHPRGSPPLSRRRGRHFGNRPYLLERTPRVSSESPGDRTRTPYYFMVVSVAYGEARKGQSRDSML